MKNFIKTLVTGALAYGLFSFSTFTYAESGLNEYNGMTESIEKVDTKKNTIDIVGETFLYDANTRILSPSGAPVTEDSLLPGDYVMVKMSTTQRYITHPLLYLIQIKTIR